MFVKPAEGLQVRDPVTRRLLPAEGKEVPENVYWIRRLRSKDIVLTSPDMLSINQIPDSQENA